ncbi:hypothetical protein [Pseudomonas sp. HS-18]|uniref:hypothetical protein n=1 Tax=Pseudomonas sp. HS-18 TaxID=2879114 RepID=UPI001CF049F0|nr:hypothetical protein [Pseudomonas sp. HS-18]UCL84501.1 hypothetical protein LDJ84_16110 [Pseudomonas sp. HS-18]
MAAVKGGDRISRYLRDLASRLDDGEILRAGFLEGATYEDGKPVAYIAAIQEFGGTFEHPGGTKYKIGDDGMAVFLPADATEFSGVTAAHSITIPARPFFRDAVKENGKRWSKGLGKLIHAGNSVEKALALTGEVVRADIQDSIRKFTSPPLSRNTRKKSAKAGFDKPLIDTSHMLNSVDYEVRKDEPAGNS